jgi:hypothetical protein
MMDLQEFQTEFEKFIDVIYFLRGRRGMSFIESFVGEISSNFPIIFLNMKFRFLKLCSIKIHIVCYPIQH